MSSGTGFLIIIVLCAFALAPLGHPGYFQPHTGFLPIYALYNWESAGLDPAWLLSPSFANWRCSGDGPLPYVIAELFRFCGLDGPSAIKGVFALAVLLGALGAYRLFARWLAPAPGLALAIAWTYAPITLSAVYVRGSLGGSLALGLLPWLALALSELPLVPSFLVGLAIGLSHFGFAVLATAVVMLCLILTSRPEPRNDKKAAGSGWTRPIRPWPGLGLVLAAAWVILAVANHGLASTRDIPIQLALPYQLISYEAGYGLHSLPWGQESPATMSLGLLPVALAGVSALLTPARRQRLAPVVTAVIVSALATTLAGPLWHAGQLSSLLPSPWQLLALGSFLLLWSASGVKANYWPWGHELTASGALVLLAIILASPFLDVPVTEVIPASRPLASFSDGEILLVRAELHGPLRHGATPRVRLFWQATRPLPQDYTVFVHVVDSEGVKWGQHDSQPAEGSMPTSSWRPGALIVDEHPVAISLEGPREGYHLLIGLYDLETGERLALDNGATQLELRSE